MAKRTLKTRIVLLRGVTPTGRNKVPMARLREVLNDAGFENVRTYIQSGNALLDTDLASRELEERVRVLIKKHIGPDLSIVVRTRAQLQKVLDENPFQQGFDISRVFFVSFSEQPPAQKVKELLDHDFTPQRLAINKKGAYLYIPDLYARGTLSNNYLERKLGISATTRNFNTMSKLIEMSK